MTDLIHWLTRQSVAVIFALVELVFVGAVILVPILLHRAARRLGMEAHAASVTDAFKTVIAFIGIVLAFSLVQVQGNLRAVGELGVKEAAAVATVDRAILRYGDPEMAAIRPGLADYARAIVADEWHQMPAMGRNTTVDALYDRLSKAARSIDPATSRQQVIFTELIRGLDEMSDLRNARLASVKMALPALSWNVVTALVVLLILLSSLIAPTLDRALTLGSIIGAIGMLFALVVIIDRPFEGEAVEPDAMQHAITIMAGRIRNAKGPGSFRPRSRCYSYVGYPSRRRAPWSYGPSFF